MDAPSTVSTETEVSDSVSERLARAAEDVSRLECLLGVQPDERSVRAADVGEVDVTVLLARDTARLEAVATGAQSARAAAMLDSRLEALE